ncbi:type II secretion system protein M [Alteromonas sp. a30]|uniref:type II secretion system protein M n=1 Tax=Alteromonas sp. a30 TaxID=2730917 RepID=UPI002280B6A3|nr:type II secretion system protein M [Alteromonas sp. a30]MCY7295663.1 type II secretion system protein M [Alteromonas sp. a30]
MNQLLEKYNALNDREKKLVVIASVVIVIALFYFVIWSPLQQSIKTNRASVERQQELLVWVKENATKAIQLKQSAGSHGGFNGSLPQAVNQTAARFSIDISRMQPQKDDIQVWVDKAPFNNVLAWLQQLEQMGISVAEADIAESDEVGMIKVRRLRLSK